MATATARPLKPLPAKGRPESMRVCFSFAAYAKTLVAHLRANGVPVLHGLSSQEFSDLETVLGFKFPPDLRLILREGLPVGPGFPNWRSASSQQLRLLTALPVLGINHRVSKGIFWCDAWGDRPRNAQEAVALANQILSKAPALVPVYRHCYIPAAPIAAANPVFSVCDGKIELVSFDLAGFFHRIDIPGLPSPAMNPPPWAATTARTVEVWTDLAGKINSAGAWWSGDLAGCLEEMFLRLRHGGWEEEEVREMMMMDSERERSSGEAASTAAAEGDGVAMQVRRLSFKLLRGGWSAEDVAYSLGLDSCSQERC